MRLIYMEQRDSGKYKQKNKQYLNLQINKKKLGQTMTVYLP